jgi:8-oxo-dGTP pyrophosphatase MutT (NUDIX family)
VGANSLEEKVMADTVQRVSVKAIMVRSGKVLLLRKAMYEGNGGNEGKWNNAGGRIEPGEHWEDALKREIFEESGIKDFVMKGPIYLGEWTPVVSGVPTQIICTFIVCETKQSKVVLDKEHDTYEWIDPVDRTKYDILTPESDVIGRYAELAKKGMFDD